MHRTPMSFSQRIDNYRRQTGRKVLTPRQSRRLRKKQYRDGRREYVTGGVR